MENTEQEKVGYLLVKGTDPNIPANTLTTCTACGNDFSIVTGELNRQRKKEVSNISCGCVSRNRYKDMVGKKFNHLDVIDWKEEKPANQVLVKCDCGTSDPFWIAGKEVKNNRKKHCGGFDCTNSSKKFRGVKKAKHGEALSPEMTRLFGRWNNMHNRCYNKNHKSYPHYGAKGIGVCHEWHEDNPKGRENFVKWFLENKKITDKEGIVNPTVDRIDNNKGYCPDNCRLADNSMQSANKTVDTDTKLLHLPKHIRHRVLASGETKYDVNIEYKDTIYRGFNFKTPIEALMFTHMLLLKHDLIYTYADKSKYLVEICDVETSKKYGTSAIKIFPVDKTKRLGEFKTYYKYSVKDLDKEDINGKKLPFLRTIRWKVGGEWVYGTTYFSHNLANGALLTLNIVKNSSENSSE